MVLTSVFHIHGNDTDEIILEKIRKRMKNNEKWFGVKYSDDTVHFIHSEIKSHSSDFVLSGESFKIYVRYCHLGL